MDLSSVYQQVQALADAIAFKQFDRACVVEFLRRFNGTKPLGYYSNGEALLAAWMIDRMCGVKQPQTLAVLAEHITPPLSASDFERAAAALNETSESLAMLVAEIARQARGRVEQP